ncbi:hypothetical protein [Burkholderia gladioli]|uniref:hypothetical protein n=1 Tax=Burkholderia gladioli TaxID=28095 RepID=UPI001FC833E3|nr:hypothetical protein [Burkholderia gladioli]
MSEDHHFPTRTNTVQIEFVRFLRCFCDCRSRLRECPRNATRCGLLLQHLKTSLAGCCFESGESINKLLGLAR